MMFERNEMIELLQKEKTLAETPYHKAFHFSWYDRLYGMLWRYRSERILHLYLD